MEWPIKVIWEGKASSQYDAETIKRRLAVLEGRQDDVAKREREFLLKLLNNPLEGQ